MFGPVTISSRCVAAIHVEIVGNELAGLPFFHDALDDGMAAFLNQQFAVVGKFRALVVALGGEMGEAGEHVELRQRGGGLANARGIARHLAADADEQVAFQRRGCAPRRPESSLLFFQLRRGEAFGVHQCLLALVIRRRQVQIGLRDFDVVAEDIVEADLERGDAGALALAQSRSGPARCLEFWLRSRSSSSSAWKPGADHSAFVQQHGRLGMNGFFQQLVDIRQFIQLLVQLRQDARA